MSSFWTRLLDLMAPRTCCCCGRRLAETEKVLCVSCLLTLPRTHHASAALDNEMARLFWGRFPVERAAAWFYYQPGAQPSRLIRELKYHHQPAIGRFIGRVAAEEMAADGFFDGVSLLIPVPLTRRRQRERGYNQSREIALGISRHTAIPVLDRAVLRTRFEQSQTHMSTTDRMRNVEGVFELTDPTAVRGRHVLLVDDVVTTGSTMTACCQVLQAVPDVTISIFSAAFTKT